MKFFSTLTKLPNTHIDFSDAYKKTLLCIGRHPNAAAAAGTLIIFSLGIWHGAKEQPREKPRPSPTP